MESFSGVVRLVSHLQGLGVKIYLEDGQLRVKAPKGVMNAELVGQLKDQKEAVISFLSSNKSGDKEAEIQAVERNSSIPLSFSQQRLWVIDQLQPGSTAYNIASGVRLNGELNIELLEQAIQKIAQRHEILRTRFVSQNGIPYQIIDDAIEPFWQVQDISDSNEDQQLVILQKALEGEELWQFDLETGPLLRVKAFVIDPCEHALIVNMHHIISDGWSTQVFLQELMQSYAQLQQGVGIDQIQLPEMKIQYADFSVWQREHASGHDFEKQLDYWVNQLQGVPQINLPNLNSTCDKKTSGEFFSFTLNESIKQSVDEFCKTQDVTPFVFWLANFNWILSRLTEQLDFAVGTPIANRNRKELEPLIGYFVNTMAIRVPIEETETFQNYLLRVKQVVLDGFQYQDVPFERVVDELNLPRYLYSTPVFQVLLNYQVAQHGHLKAFGLEIEPLVSKHRASKFPLRLGLVETQSQIKAELEYHPELFPEQWISIFADLLVNQVQSIIDNANLKALQTDLLGQHQQASWLVQWGHLEASESTAQADVLELFLQQCEANPLKIAVETDTSEISFVELKERVDRCAVNLIQAIKQSVETAEQPLIAILLDRNIDFVIWMLASWRAGCCFIPLDTHYPEGRIQLLLDQSQPQLLVHNQAEEVKGFSGVQIKLADANYANASKDSDEGAFPEIHSQDLAYVIYTSGSTGIPKGVEIAHGSLPHLLQALENSIYKANPCERVLVNASFGFDASVKQWLQLCQGRTIVLVDHETRLNSKQMLAYLDSKKIECADFTPTHVKTLLSELKQNNLSLSLPLKVMLIGGEHISQDLWLQLAELHRIQSSDESVSVFNLYGPTEACVDSTCVQIDSGTMSSLGTLLPHVKGCVVDKNNQLVPVGFPGELLLGGPGLARGYRNDVQMSEKAFNHLLFTQLNGRGVKEVSRFYRTGDKVRWLSSGQLQYLGRMDEQIKWQGHRIEPAEIEAAIQSFPHINRAGVKLFPEVGNQPAALVAFIQFDPSFDASKKEVENASHWQNGLRDHLLNNLPHYLLPSVFVCVEQLPISAHGKLDRAKLVWDGILNENYVSSFRAPTTETELKLVKLWQGLLPGASEAQIGIDLNFFQLGGHSLLATQLVAQIKGEFQIEFTLRNVFEASSLQTMADMIDARVLEQSQENHITPVLDRNNVPVTVQQRKLCILEELFDAGATYLMPVYFKVQGEWREELFKASLQQLQKEHDLLRVSIAKREDDFYFAPVSDSIELEIHQDETDNPEGLLERVALKPFAVFQGLLWRVVIIEAGSHRHVAVVFHHLISDAWSNRLLLNRWLSIYQALSNNEFATIHRSEKNQKSIDYLDYAQWQRNLVKQGKLGPQTDYWLNQVKGLTPLELPTDFPRPALQTFQGGVVERSLGVDSLKIMLSHFSEKGFTVFDVMMAGFALSLSRFAQQKQFAVGVPVSGRHQAGLDGVVGLFVNTLPLVIDIEEENTLDNLLSKIKQSLLGLYENQDCPLEMILDSISSDQQRDPSRPPLFQVMLNFMQESEANGPVGERISSHLGGVEFELGQVHSTTAKYELTLGVVQKQNCFNFALEYNSRLFSKTTAERFLDLYCCVLSQMEETLKESSDNAVAEITGVDESALDNLVELNGISELSNRGVNKSLQERFAENVKQTPNQIAVMVGEQAYTFLQLDHRANQLANELVNRGVKSNDRILLFMDRSLDWIAAQIAALKLSVAFIPLDPNTPVAKVRSILDEACPQQVISIHTTLIDSLRKARCLESTILNCEDVSSTSATDFVPVNEIPAPDEMTPVYCIFTSGSTGVPKGVVVPQRGLSNLIDWHLDYHQLANGDRVSHVAGQGFDASIWEIWPTLIGGGSLVLAPEGILLDCNALVDWLDQQRISQCFLPTAVVEQLFQLWQAQSSELCFSHLKRILTGGDQLRACKPLGFPVTVFNHYGPTEASVVTTVCEVTNEATYLPLIGYPIHNCKLRILDKLSRPVPPGSVGELHIGGKPVALGYLKEEGKQGFYQNDTEFYYASGDLVRIHGEGGLQFVHRRDQQIQLNGVRIELSEIEFNINLLKWVQESAVTLQQGKILVASIVLSEEGRKLGLKHYNTAQLVEFLRESLSGILNFVAIPKIAVLMDHLPLMDSGKIDRKALPIIDENKVNELFRYVAPSTPLEESVQAIWQAVLQQENISVEANFFSLGGHSLQATQIVNKVAKEFQVSLPLQTVFQNPTIHFMATQVEHLRSKATSQTVSSIDQSSRRKASVEQTNSSQDQEDKQRELKEKLKGLSKEQLQALLLKKQQKKDYK